MTRVLTNTMITRIYLPFQTNVPSDCKIFCGEDKDLSSCIRNEGWKWGLTLHMETNRKGVNNLGKDLQMKIFLIFTVSSVQYHGISAHSSRLSKSSDLIAPEISHKVVVVVIKPEGMPMQGDKWTSSKSDLLNPF